MKLNFSIQIMKANNILFAFILALFPVFVMGQTLEDAKKWYLEGNYEQAKPVFEREYQINPTNASLNQWLGVIAFVEGDYRKAIPLLEFASQKKIIEAHIYLGELYTRIYRFDDAEKEFEKYQRAKRRDKGALAKLEEKRDYAEKMRKAVNRTEDIQIIDSLVVPKADFLSAYNLSASAGTLEPINKFFNNQANSDKTVYMNERKDKIYYSLGNPLLGYDLYSMEKLLDTFGNEKKLTETINDTGSQAYPFVLPDGITLYFSSTGHESLGGYDLFVTRYNINSDSYLTPNHLNMPFNSVFNDYMMAVDEEKGVGWFASDRFQHSDSVCVYTFIPNARVTLLESDDEEMLARRAIISSISETWKEGVDYASLRERAAEKVVAMQSKSGDFSFVINDNTTYHFLSDFRNLQARELFSEALELEKRLQLLRSNLSTMRDQFASSSTPNTLLNAEILNAEYQTKSIYDEIEQLKIRARNEEIRNTF